MFEHFSLLRKSTAVTLTDDSYRFITPQAAINMCRNMAQADGMMRKTDRPLYCVAILVACLCSKHLLLDLRSFSKSSLSTGWGERLTRLQQVSLDQ